MQFYLLPATLYHKVDSGVQKIREEAVRPSQSDTPKPLQMQMGLSSLRSALKQDAEKVGTSELVDGMEYGVLRFHPSATMVVNGIQVKNFGNVYVELWNWNAKEKTFFQEDGLGRIHTEKNPCAGVDGSMNLLIGIG